jgi:hypothetical protein
MDMANGPNVADNGAGAESSGTTRAASKPGKRKVKPAKEQSSIGFPYLDMDAAVSVALAMIGAGGVPLTREQLAGVMGQSVGSGSFVGKVAAARIFGLMKYDQGKYELTNLGFSIVDSDEARQKTARVEAFLTVPLYKKVYDEFRGKQLPPRPHGLEQAFVRFGVASKQKQAARQAFDRSARQAGFFAAGQDRLIEPIIGGRSGGDRGPSPSFDDGQRNDEPPALETSGLHPFVRGLLETLPEPHTNWTIEGRAKWLQAAARCFDLIYNGAEGDIAITPTPSVDKTSTEK